ncbi:uncharacterized protein LOC142168292 [Nicotiana tabacum]|uniref:Uncharacterized protein LOC142168292 n=1 Tax=Nicotiana tabacum TaxID=4097 RepID=A0AC58SJ93_TOBAC
MYTRIGGNQHKKFKKNYNVQCDFYKMKRHSKENSFKIVGYPPDFKPKRRENVGNNNATYNDLFTGKVKEIGKEEAGLYLQQMNAERRNFRNFSLSSKELGTSKYESEDVELWHRRFGHMSVIGLQKLLYVNLQTIRDRVNKYTICPCAKQTRLPFPSSSIKSTSPFDLIHMDIWGPYKVATLDGNKYFLAVVDDYSRMTWHFLSFVQTQFNKKVKIIRTDNGTEFVNSVCDTLFKNLGIIHQRTRAYTPQQNGVVERKHKHILEVTRAIRFQAQISIKFWGHNILAAVYLINRMPSYVVYMLPYEKLHNRKPFQGHLRVIICLCFAKTVQEHDKLLPSARMAAHMGYSEIQKVYVLYDLYTHSFFVNRDVTFRGDTFPFTKQKFTTQPLFVDTTPNSRIFIDTSDIIFDVPTRLNESAGTQTPTKALTDFTMENQTSAHISDPQDHIEEETSAQQPIPVMHITENHQNDQLNQQQQPATRKSSRGTQPPIWMKDFVSLNIYQDFEAIKDPKWVEAMIEEIKALEANQTWDVVSLPQALQKFKFKQSQFDHSLFMRRTNEGIVIVLVYVDDNANHKKQFEACGRNKSFIAASLQNEGLGRAKILSWH